MNDLQKKALDAVLAAGFPGSGWTGRGLWIAMPDNDCWCMTFKNHKTLEGPVFFGLDDPGTLRTLQPAVDAVNRVAAGNVEPAYKSCVCVICGCKSHLLFMGCPLCPCCNKRIVATTAQEFGYVKADPKPSEQSWGKAMADAVIPRFYEVGEEVEAYYDKLWVRSLIEDFNDPGREGKILVSIPNAESAPKGAVGWSVYTKHWLWPSRLRKIQRPPTSSMTWGYGVIGQAPPLTVTVYPRTVRYLCSLAGYDPIDAYDYCVFERTNLADQLLNVPSIVGRPVVQKLATLLECSVEDLSYETPAKLREAKGAK